VSPILIVFLTMPAARAGPIKAATPADVLVTNNIRPKIAEVYPNKHNACLTTAAAAAGAIPVAASIMAARTMKWNDVVTAEAAGIMAAM
jgi:hypothetical protein